MWQVQHLYGNAAAGYDHYIRRIVPCYDTMQARVVDTVKELCGSAGPGEVIELGVGSGSLAFHLLSSLTLRKYHGFETCQALCKLAKAKLSVFSANIIVTRRDFRKTAWPKGVGAVVSTLTMHYLNNEEKKRTFQKAFRALRPNGVIVIGDRVISRNPSIGRVYRRRMKLYWQLATKKWTARQRAEHRTYDDSKEEPWFLDEELRWLQEAGFANVECIWKDFNYCVFCGTKPKRG